MNETTLSIIEAVNRKLADGHLLSEAVREVAAERAMKASTVDQRIRRAGYRYELSGRLVPMNPPDLVATQSEAAA